MSFKKSSQQRSFNDPQKDFSISSMQFQASVRDQCTGRLLPRCWAAHPDMTASLKPCTSHWEKRLFPLKTKGRKVFSGIFRYSTCLLVTRGKKYCNKVHAWLFRCQCLVGPTLDFMISTFLIVTARRVAKADSSVSFPPPHWNPSYATDHRTLWLRLL